LNRSIRSSNLSLLPIKKLTYSKYKKYFQNINIL